MHTTVREWFRGARARYRPETEEARQAIFAIRQQDWTMVEFWGLLWGAQATSAQDRPAQHRWELVGYHWCCRDCPATVPSDTIDEPEPPASSFDSDCLCLACRPCNRE